MLPMHVMLPCMPCSPAPAVHAAPAVHDSPAGRTRPRLQSIFAAAVAAAAKALEAGAAVLRRPALRLAHTVSSPAVGAVPQVRLQRGAVLRHRYQYRHVFVGERACKKRIALQHQGCPHDEICTKAKQHFMQRRRQSGGSAGSAAASAQFTVQMPTHRLGGLPLGSQGLQGARCSQASAPAGLLSDTNRLPDQAGACCIT